MFNKNMLYREEAEAYMLNPVDVDSRRGLKRTWKDREESPKPTSKEKGSKNE